MTTTAEELKIAEYAGGLEFTGKLGEGIDKLLEESKKAAERHSGAKSALVDSAEKMASIHRRIDADMESGNIPDLATQALCKGYVTLCIESARNLVLQYEHHEAMEKGRADAYSRAISIAQNFHNMAGSRIKQLQTPPEEKPKGERAKPSRKGRSLAEIRATKKTPDKKAPKKATKPKKGADVAKK